jgi:hypothetical protein
MHYAIDLEGLEPGLVMNNPECMMKQDGGRVPKPAEEAESKCYRLAPAGKFKKGELCIPGHCIMASLLTVTQPFKIQMRGKRLAPKKWLAGASVVKPATVGLGVEEYEVFVTPAVVQSKRVMRARPRVFPWRASFALTFSDADPLYGDFALALQKILPDMLAMAGVQSGLLDNRPGSPKKPGPHGRFKTLQCELVED